MQDFATFVEPIKKKWVYNFLISPKTRNIEKPEWYLNQTLKWIYENIDHVNDVVESDGNNMKYKFIISLLELVMVRLKDDISKISEFTIENSRNEAILVHTYNEVIQFTKVIKKLLGDGYQNLNEKCDLMSVFSSKTIFEKIAEVEWDYAEKNIKHISNSPIRWDSVLDSEFVDHYKVPRCVDYLLMLLNSVTERVECFRQYDCQFTLIELQCSLLSKFLTFLKKSTETSPTGVNILSDMLFLSNQSTIDLTRLLRILNGVNFLRLLLKERSFIPASLTGDKLDSTIANKVDRLAQDYRKFFDQLVNRVVSVYESEIDSRVDVKDFLDFIRPKLSQHIYQIIQDESSRVFHERRTRTLLRGLDEDRE